ncbi:quercetin dioxygenase-like cupin family protein [Natronocella acetinitrilica]|uniref:Quercetin dioxygenase-like cupin family protein n=1 Tax=Natronocella acetinitrilica TaxID=414046 RepID=A0AAE3KDT2_9GAMM|nr:cupin domain-containing protein [Natronocella acetinitrilica]MCP1677241.1 quercetin dioxygenase-like cupin family protein [Natronocella acetinitrilica]
MKMQTVVTHAAADGSDFEPGLREYFTYRDTGIKEMTGGAFTAHIIRAVPGKTPKPEWHVHTVGFQLFYVLKGWVEFEYEDIGRVRMEAGSSVYQPSGVKHRELAHSDDLEVLEVVSPATFATESLESKDPS